MNGLLLPGLKSCIWGKIQNLLDVKIHTIFKISKFLGAQKPSWTKCLEIFYLKRQGYCVCVKYIMLCNCLCSSSSSCFPASFTENIRKFKAKNYFTDHWTAIKICSFRDSVPVYLFSTWLLQRHAKFRATFHSYSSDTTQ